MLTVLFNVENKQSSKEKQSKRVLMHLMKFIQNKKRNGSGKNNQDHQFLTIWNPDRISSKNDEITEIRWKFLRVSYFFPLLCMMKVI